MDKSKFENISGLKFLIFELRIISKKGLIFKLPLPSKDNLLFLKKRSLIFKELLSLIKFSFKFEFNNLVFNLPFLTEPSSRFSKSIENKIILSLKNVFYGK